MKRSCILLLMMLILTSAGCKKDKENKQKVSQTAATTNQLSNIYSRNNEPAQISISTSSVTEGGEGITSTLVLPVTCSVEPRKNRDVTVKWSTSDATGTSEAQATAGEDYTPSNGSITFKNGESLQQQIAISVKGDVNVEEDEIFIVTLEQPVNAIIANSIGEALIINDDSEISQIPDPTPISDNYMLIKKNDLENLPTNGPEWDYLKDQADKAVGFVLDASSEYSPWLPNFNDRNRLPAKYLGAALVYASSYSGDKEPYKQAVKNALRHIIGSEEEPSTDGVPAYDAMLATARQLPAWIMAADLIGFDRTLTGTRTKLGSSTGTDWTKTTFEEWLSSLMTKEIGESPRWTTIVGTQEDSAANWAAHSTASRIAACLYLNDTAQLEKAITVMKGFLGDTASYPTSPPVGTPGFIPTNGFDSSWACNFKTETGGWHPINSSACGSEMDGIVVEDIGRSKGAYPDWDAKGISYAYETLSGLYLAAILLERHGEPAFSWSNEALKRAILWINRQGQIPSINNYECERHIIWIANHFYGLNLPTQPPSRGRGLAFTDWLFP
ncbi:MAG: Calx-beta domain-containing protein [Candidatus Electrothrix aestuarii]|uniref:Calx-beta domain-containing protein n=1 Tax=Candidatus Electrothrix aestuarii TaxID=3062594 RepID=A0AAU8M0S8_9BACT|nr:Calx-beta domain-containing protein [Candidatus Electrothrix aestuarii]